MEESAYNIYAEGRPMDPVFDTERSNPTSHPHNGKETVAITSKLSLEAFLYGDTASVAGQKQFKNQKPDGSESRTRPGAKVNKWYSLQDSTSN